MDIAPAAPHPGRSAVTPPPLPQRHLHLDSGPLHLDYQGPADQIRDIAAELAATSQFTVRVDDDVQPGHTALPCARLWGLPAPAHTCSSVLNLDRTPNDQGIAMPNNIIHAPATIQLIAPAQGPSLDQLVADRAWTYQHVFGFRTERTRDGHTLTMPVGRVVGLMMPRSLAHQVRAVLGPECGPVFTDSHHSWMFLTACPATGTDIAETTLALYRHYSVMAIAHPGQLITLPTPGDPSHCWIHTPEGDQLPEFAEIVAALGAVASRGGPR